MLSVAAACLSLLPASATGFRVARSRAAGGAEDCYSMYDGLTLLSLTPCTEEAAKGMTEFAASHMCRLLSEDDELRLPASGGCLDVAAVCSSQAASKFTSSFGSREVNMVDADAGAYLRNIGGYAKPYSAVSISGDVSLSSDFYSDWRDLEARDARVEAAVAASGGAATIETVGESLEGRSIKLVRFTGKGYSPGKPKLVLTFGMHAREWIASMAGIYAVETLAAQAAANSDFLAGVEVVIAPMTNPDGFIYSMLKDRMHRKNTAECGWWGKGVDINRNFNISFGTGSSRSCYSDTFHGPGPNSEPETRIIEKIMTESPMTVYIDVHAYTQVVLSAYGYMTKDHPRKSEYDALGVRMTDAIEAKHGANYEFGAIAQLLYKASGSSVDMADTFGALGYCYELRPARNGVGGFAPPVSEILPASEECYEGILVAISHIKAQ